MKKLLVLMFSIVLLGSCDKCYKCRQYTKDTQSNTADGNGEVDSIFCRANFTSSDDFENYVESFEQQLDTVFRYSNGSGAAFTPSDTILITHSCRRKIF
tara:strand:- start:58 stop:354 length:297 start_codon:yes stop_codon:yes gene_type:complete